MQREIPINLSLHSILMVSPLNHNLINIIERICGDEEMGAKDYPYLFFPKVLDGNINETVCVKSCASKG